MNKDRILTIDDDPDILDVLDLTFSTEVDDFGRLLILDLVKNGRNIPVTDDNKITIQYGNIPRPVGNCYFSKILWICFIGD